MFRQSLIAQLKRDEAVRFKPYKCTAGKLTIGVGRNLDDVGLTEAEVDFLLRNDIDRVERELIEHVPEYLYLDHVRQTVLANMAFNLGISRLKEFRNMLAAISRGEYAVASDEMLNSRWADQVGSRARRLALIMKTGAFQNDQG